MISCTEFRSRFDAGTDDTALLEHLRRCDACLDHAAHLDPDVMFRAIGGEMVPPGGVDAFVADVMRGIDLRSKDAAIARPRFAWTRRLAAAAAIAAGVTGATLLYQARQAPVGPARQVAAAAVARIPVATTTKPVVETYSSSDATILEVGGDNARDVKIVMVIDEKLPADL